MTECAAAIQTALDAFAAFGLRAYAKGTFKIASTVTIVSNADLGEALFNYTGSGVAVRIGSATSGTFIFRLNVVAPRVVNVNKVSAGWAAVAGSIGIEVSNLNSSTLTIRGVRNFETGLRFYGVGTGCVHNIVNLGFLENNKINLALAASSTGWCNQNQFNSGRLSHEGAEGTNVSGTRHIQMGVTTNPINNNLWLNTSVEGDCAEYHAVVAGSANLLIGARWEVTGGARVKWESAATQNTIMYGYKADSIVETFAGGAGSGNVIYSAIRSYLARSGGPTGVQILENQSGNTSPADVIMGAGAKVAGTSPATGYTVARSAAMTRMKREADGFDRLQLDHLNGRLYAGTGAAAPTAYFGPQASLTIWVLSGASLAFAADNTYDLGIASYRPRYIRAGTAVQTGAFATGSRPSATTAGAGASIFDSTLGKPIWSNGTAWVDATGASA